MDAVIEKKQPKVTSRWTSRLFRLKDRRLMHFKKDCKDFGRAYERDAVIILDLTHMSSLTIDKKHRNVLIVRHPKLDIALRFPTHEIFISWLKVLASFGNDTGKKVEAAIPSNFAYGIWHILQSLYSHPQC